MGVKEIRRYYGARNVVGVKRAGREEEFQIRGNYEEKGKRW